MLHREYGTHTFHTTIHKHNIHAIPSYTIPSHKTPPHTQHPLTHIPNKIRTIVTNGASANASFSVVTMADTAIPKPWAVNAVNMMIDQQRKNWPAVGARPALWR